MEAFPYTCIFGSKSRTPEGLGRKREAALPAFVHTQGRVIRPQDALSAGARGCSFQLWKAFPSMSCRVTAGMSFLPDKPPPGRRVWDDGSCQRSVWFSARRSLHTQTSPGQQNNLTGGPGRGNARSQVQTTEGNQTLLSCTLFPTWLCLFVSLLRRTC